MRKNCISFVLSGMLVCTLDVWANDTITANFADKSSGSDQGTYDSAKKNSSSAQYATDWIGSDNFLNVQTSDLTFTFKNSASASPAKLLFKDGFTFNNSDKKTLKKITIAWSNQAKAGGNATLIFGQNGTPYSRLMIQENLEVALTGFQKIEVGGNLFLESKAKLDAKDIELHNKSGIVLQKESQITTKNFTNDGTLVMGEGTSLQIEEKIEATNGVSKTQGTIDVQGAASLVFNSAQNSTIKNQDILVRQGSLTIKNTSPAPSLSLDSVKLEAKSGSVSIEGFETLESKGLSLKSVEVQAKALKNLSIDGQLSLTNGILKTEADLIIKHKNNNGTASTILVEENNLISAGEKSITLEDSYTFKGSGKITLEGKTIILGKDGTSTLMKNDANDSVKLALKAAESVIAKNLNVENLTISLVSKDQSKLQNKTLTLGNGAVIEAINEAGELNDLVISKSEAGNIGTIEATNGQEVNATLRGKNIRIIDNNITLKGDQQKATLTLEAEEGSVTLGKPDDTQALQISGSGTTENNVLDLQTSKVYFGKKVELNKVSVIAGGESGISFYGTKGGELNLKNSTTISTKRGESYGNMYFGVQGVKNNAELADSDRNQLKFEENTELKASNFAFYGQKVSLGKTGSNGVSLKLYALGQSGESGTFSFGETSFSAVGASPASTSTISLYSNEEAVFLAKNLTLDGVNLESKSNESSNPLAALDLSQSGGKLTVLGSVTISANGIYNTPKETTQRNQGIGMDVYVGDSTKTGQLTIKSDVQSDKFVVGGNLVIDNSTSNGGTGSFEIELGKNGSSGSPLKLSEQKIDLEILGGITAIGKENNGIETQIKAKKFIFGEKSNLTSINGTLKLNTKEDAEIEVKGKVILQGTNTAEAKIQVVKNNNGDNIALKLHDIQSTGKGSITHKGLTFMDSNIVVKGSGDQAKNLTLTDSTTGSTPQMMNGTIASISLEGGELEFKQGDGSATTAGIKLNANGYIQSSGDSKFTTKTIEVGKADTDRFALKITDGTFTLIEESTKNQIGEIALGDKESGKGGSFKFLKSNSNSTTYNELKLQGNLISFGASSIIAQKLTITQKEGNDNKNYTISSTNGNLHFDLKEKTTNQEFKNNFVLENGGISFGSTVQKVTLSESSIQSKGNSRITASELDLNGASINANGGRLLLQGVKTSTDVGNVLVGNSGVLAVQNYQGDRASLRLREGSNVGLSAVAPYVSSNNLLGGGSFGKIEVESLSFEGKSGEKKLISISLSSESSAATLQDDRLFALREGGVILIDTESGIKRKTSNTQYENITLQDVSVDKGTYTSIILTPKLEMGKTFIGDEFVKRLMLDISVSKNSVTGFIESISDPQKKKLMENIFSNDLYHAIAESILKSKDNAFKAGLAEYIASGNTEIVASTLQYVTGALRGVTDGIYASDKITQELKMLRATNLENRMLRGGNPYVSKVEIAHLLKALSGVRYASEDDELLLDAEYSGPNYGSLWATYEGATSFGKMDNASINGLSAGYDTLLGDLKEHLLGFYINYGYGTYSANFVSNDSHNFGLGLYSRLAFKQNEVDLILSQSVGMNRTNLSLGASKALAVQYLNQSLKYNFFITDAQVRYGYLIAVGDEESPFYFKPFGGIDFGVTINSESKGDGVAPIGIDRAVNFKLGVSVGLEMKKYFNEGSHIYLLPVLEKGLLNDSGITNLGFVGAQTIPFAQIHQVNIAFALYAGGQGSVSENVSIAGGLGVKVDIETKDLLTNWNVGFKYKF